MPHKGVLAVAAASPMLTWVFYIIIDLMWNVIKIRIRKIKPDYFGQSCRRVAAGLIVLLTWNPYFDPLTWTSVEISLPFIGFQFSSFYLCFDPALNKALGKPVLYRGAESGWLDSLPFWAYITLKILCVPVLIYTLNTLT